MNLRACCNGKYVTENGTYQAVSDTPYEWFIREWLKPEPYGDAMRFGSWHDRPMDIALQPDGTLRAVSHGKPTPDRLFRLVPVEDGVTVRRLWRNRRTWSFSVWATTPCR